MIKWQYSWDDVKPFDSITAQSKFLNEKGAEGWELVSATELEYLGGRRLRLYWKRKIYLHTKEKK